ncbi:sugar ABC transporter permease [Salinibacterium sp. G-O1]|uniref:carbohydrate ABC transporter permease n=1 Tax=Salinibacterium sp. G-O1 TaxID=3046208 RepID=UPI0024BBB2E9|nr:sugar ABC transporter permease [Salinibacterium sp. G-O1]MDJ0334922.1 sugar ABC transporter permease [Salinibacterium sp. G-O1]
MTVAPMRLASKGGSARRVPLRVVVLFILPAFALFAVFLLFPLLQAVSYSFFDWKGTRQQGFIGIDNYIRLFTDLPFSEQIPRALGHNLLFFAGTVVLQNSIGLFLAVQLQRFKRMRRLFQTLYTTPYLVSPLVVGYLWSLLLSPQFGLVNEALRVVGLDALALPWLGDPTLALPVLILISVWQWMGFPVLLYGAALGGLPVELNDAAAIDGANGWKRFRYVTGPMLTPVIGTVSILTFISSMEVFTLAYAVGGSTGSPAGATDVLSLLFYRVSFQSGLIDALGLSSALATLMLIFIFGGAVLATRLLARQERKLS